MSNTELLSHQYLTLTIMEERYALPVGRVREVLECARITSLPCRANYFKGLINVRGKGIPVLDLRLRFGMPDSDNEKDTSIIVVDMMTDETVSVIGLRADAVHEVIELEDSAIAPVPKFGSRSSEAFLRGVGRIDEEFVLILNLDLLFHEEDIMQSVEVAQTAAS